MQPALFDRPDVPTGGGRREHDAYYTEQPLADFLFGTLCDGELVQRPVHAGSTVLEPHVGAGAFLRSARRVTNRLLANDIDPRAAGLDLAPVCWRTVGSFLDFNPGRTEVDWVLGNPPFSPAPLDHVRHALSFARDGVAFLMPFALLCPAETRATWWDEHPATYVLPLKPRPRFTGQGNAMHDLAWFIWDRHRRPLMELRPTRWR